MKLQHEHDTDRDINRKNKQANRQRLWKQSL